MKTQCPCGAVYPIKPEFLGKMTLCKRCGRSFLIEALSSPSSPPESSSPEYVSPPESSPAPSVEETSQAPPPEEIVQKEEIEPIQAAALEPLSGSPTDQIESDDFSVLTVQAEAALKDGGRRPLLAMAVAAVAGTLVGAGLMGLIRQSEIDELKSRLITVSQELQSQDPNRQHVGDLNRELGLVQEEIRLLEGADYPAGSIPQALAAAAVLEYKTVEALLRQQIAALESGAGLTVSARATTPDSKLAEAVEEEMLKLEARLEGLRREAGGLAEEPRFLVQTAIATEELNLAILNRNRLIARYGLSAPWPASNF